MNQYDMADAGFKVFGLHKIIGNQCGCGNEDCKAIGKHPINSGWQYTDHWSEEQWEVIEMSGQMETGYGVLVKGWLVIDVDARKGGVDSFHKLCADTGVDLLGMAGLAVATGSGGGSMHLYYKITEGIAMVQSHREYTGIDFKTTGFVVGPGSLHASGVCYEPIHGHPDDIKDAPDSIVELLRKPDRFRAEFRGDAIDISEDEISALLSHIDPGCDHETWVRCGMAIHDATGGTGFHLWDAWSAKAKDKYPKGDIMDKRWQSFGKSANPVTIGTLIHYAEQNGWQAPVTFVAQEIDYEEKQPANGLPFSISSVDLLRPPGFVGQVCQWINAQCLFPRQHLAVAAALVAMGNVSGLRYTDDKDNVSLNMFALCVAGSGTGKESIQQAIFSIHKAAGVSRAAHGGLKSEQEVIRNLIRHQAALYVLDEMGILLQKISNAQKRGGAAYLDGVIGVLMSAFGKAHGFMSVSGDVRDALEKELVGQLATCQKAINENEDKTGHASRAVERLQRAIDNLDSGLENPFLSLIGFTTPITFNGLVDVEQATNGFLGRSLMINEKETNPKAKKRFKKEPMSQAMAHTIMALATAGYYEHDNKRVEFYGEKSRIRTTPEAYHMLEQCAEWLYEYAEEHKEKTGLEAIPKRAYEMIAKVSTILAVPEGVRTEEHVKWAFALAHRDIEEKIRLAYSNDREKDNPEQAIMARIMSLVDTDHGEKSSVIANRLRKYKIDAVEKALDKLEKGGLIRREVSRHPVNGKESTKWFAIDVSSMHDAPQSLQ